MTLPKPSGEFVWVQEPWGSALRCTPLAALARHCFTTRELTFDADDGGVAWTAISRTLGIAPDALVRMRQVHGAGIFEAAAGMRTAALSHDWPEADIAITDDPSLGLSVTSADCVPILLADRRTGAVAAIHAGWKGTAAGAALAAVQGLEWRFGSVAADMVAAVGPSIGPCCYEVDRELERHFDAHPDAAAWFSNDARPRLDLWRATRDQLTRAGIPTDEIHVSGLCTSHHPAVFHSYRRDAAAAGRLVAAIRSGRDTTL
jgi:polyphenol oxidase